MPIPFYHPTPAPPGVFENNVLPQPTANLVSRFFYHWLTPIMKVGYSRPLEVEDLWKLSDDLHCDMIANKLEAHFMARMPPSRRTVAYAPAEAGTREEEKITSSSVATSMSTESISSAEKARLAQVTEEEDPINNSAQPMEEMSVELQDPNLPAGPLTEELRQIASRSSSRSISVQDGQVNPADVKKYGKRKAKKIATGDLVYEGGNGYDMSLWKAMAHTGSWEWTVAVCHNAVGNALRVTAPLVTRKLINQLTLAHTYHVALEDGRSTAGLERANSVGYGIGLALGMFGLQFFGSMFIYQAYQRGGILGCKMRAAVVALIFRKSMRLSGRARLEMTNGRINTMVSADASYLDWMLPATVDFPVSPVVIAVGIGLLIYTLGYSALVGAGLLIIIAPTQGFLFKAIMTSRTEQQRLVDGRVRLLNEIINNIRAVKLYAYESHFADRISDIRQQEHVKLGRYGLLRSLVNGIFYFTPILAAVLTFITYGLTGHTLDAGKIFASLQLFNIIKSPIQYLPMQLTGFMDSLSGIGRIRGMFTAEELPEKINIDTYAPHSVSVRGDFQFDSATPPDQDKNDDKSKDMAKKMIAESTQCSPEGSGTSTPVVEEEMKPFALRDISVEIPQGWLVCIVGRVGTGKTALLSGMINEMRQISGKVTFGGSVSYVPQQAWMQSGSVRENIVFGADPGSVNLEKVKEVINACCLKPDVDMWQYGDQTQIGEKGITLSGGQRQRICVARAAYEDSAVVLLDDPLSAVDAYVGHHLLENCILNGPFANRTRILVTHHLDVLPKADLVLVMDRDGNNDGRIIQQGTYEELRAQDGVFRTLIEEFGSASRAAATSTEGDEASLGDEDAETKDEEQEKGQDDTVKAGKLIMDEERNFGSIKWSTYNKYCLAIGSWWYVVGFLSILVLGQAAQVGNSLFLGYWSANSIGGFSQGQYMAVYAGLGGAIAVFVFAGIYTMILAGLRASYNMFNGAWSHVLRSPTSWHDRTPTGRIISRLSKDIQMLDDKLAQFWNQFLMSAFGFFGTMALVLYTYPWLGFIFIPLILFYYLTANYYRQSSRELKRVDSLLRSHVYSSFAEQLAGLAVIRAFNQQPVFQHRLQSSLDNQNRAYILSTTASRWLVVRLEFCSQILVLMIGVFGVIFRNDVNPARFGVVLTYAMAATSSLSSLIPTFAFVEQEMNNVERIQHYNELDVEAAPTLPTDPKPNEWPTRGAVTFNNVEFKYRPDLPLVLKGLSFSINAGEKVGIIGRTGAGKSSVAQALLRTVELCGGAISVDGVGLHTLGLETLRSRLAIIPQDAFLFAGTVRDNIDPSGSKSDAQLNEALNLIHGNASATQNLRQKFKLDAQVLAEGSNFSAGEKQLLALMRALVRNCKVLLLDEATSSVDPETDALIQRIIQREFSDVTLISIAHRLQTVAYYNRILVLDAGQIAEYDTPLALFDTPNSIFRSLCEKKDLHREDLLRIQADAVANGKSS